jgi:molybdopterin/thiamine biosynthesis adenylyltransferase
MNIIIVGDGGIGSNLSFPLIKYLKYHRDKEDDSTPIHIKVVDGDDIELKNLSRQHFIAEDIGEKKSDMTSEFLSEMVKTLNISNVTIESCPVYLKEENKNIIGEDDVVLVGVDNYVTRKTIEDRTLELNSVFVVFGGNEYVDGDVNILHKKEGSYITPMYSDKHPEINSRDKFPDEQGCEEASISSPQLLFVNMQVAIYMLEAFYTYLQEGKSSWHEKVFDIKTGNVRIIKD